MKNFACLVLLISMLGCCKTENGDCIAMKSNRLFIEEEFKDGYSISFPAQYTGRGLFKTLSIHFDKESPSGVKYYFFNPGFINYDFFLDSIPNPSVHSVIFRDLTLTEKVDFCQKNKHEMVFFHNNDGPFSKGVLYMKVEGVYREGLEVDFDIVLLSEVVEVLKTIRKH